jgi:hypothetical protein
LKAQSGSTVPPQIKLSTWIEYDFSIDETTRKRRAKRSAHWQNHIDWDLKHEVEMHKLLVRALCTIWR